jgi:hypothetical protein
MGNNDYSLANNNNRRKGGYSSSSNENIGGNPAYDKAAIDKAVNARLGTSNNNNNAFDNLGSSGIIGRNNFGSSSLGNSNLGIRTNVGGSSLGNSNLAMPGTRKIVYNNNNKLGKKVANDNNGAMTNNNKLGKSATDQVRCPPGVSEYTHVLSYHKLFFIILMHILLSLQELSDH